MSESQMWFVNSKKVLLEFVRKRDVESAAWAGAHTERNSSNISLRDYDSDEGKTIHSVMCSTCNRKYTLEKSPWYRSYKSIFSLTDVKFPCLVQYKTLNQQSDNNDNSDFIPFSKSAVSALFGKKNSGADAKFTTSDSMTNCQSMRGEPGILSTDHWLDSLVHSRMRWKSCRTLWQRHGRDW